MHIQIRKVDFCDFAHLGVIFLIRNAIYLKTY